MSYLIRLDDACPTMNISKWQKVEDVLDSYNTCPMVGGIPHNDIDNEGPNFWLKVKKWES